MPNQNIFDLVQFDFENNLGLVWCHISAYKWHFKKLVQSADLPYTDH